MTLESHDIVSRRDIQANRGVTKPSVGAHQLPAVGIDLHRAALEHKHASILNDIPFAVDDEDAPRGSRRRTDS